MAAYRRSHRCHYRFHRLPSSMHKLLFRQAVQGTRFSRHPSKNGEFPSGRRGHCEIRYEKYARHIFPPLLHHQPSSTYTLPPPYKRSSLYETLPPISRARIRVSRFFFPFSFFFFFFLFFVKCYCSPRFAWNLRLRR